MVSQVQRSSQPTFYVVCQKDDLVAMLSQVRTDLVVRSLLKLGPSVDGIVMGGKQRLDVSGASRAVADVGKELELGLHAARREDDERLASGFPGFQRRHHVFKQWSLEVAVAKARCP